MDESFDSEQPSDQFQIVYREATASMEVIFDVEQLTRAEQGSTIEMQIDVAANEWHEDSSRAQLDHG